MKFCLSLLAAAAAQNMIDPDEIRETINNLPLTCSSTVRFKNQANSFYLHS